MKGEFICKFLSKMNEIANGIVYELYDWNHDYYLVKWEIGSHQYEKKYTKKSVDKMFNDKEYVSI